MQGREYFHFVRTSETLFVTMSREIREEKQKQKFVPGGNPIKEI